MKPPQAIRVDIYLVLFDDTAHTRHLGDTGDGVQLIADKPVLNGAKFLEG